MKRRSGFVLIGLMAAIALIPGAILVSMKAQDSIRSASRYFASARTRANLTVARDFIAMNAVDADSDSRFELRAETASNGLPADIGIAPKDEYGSDYLYCTWDLGAPNANLTYSSNSFVGPSAGVIGRLVSAGANRAVETVCGAVGAGGDDVLLDIYESTVAYSSSALGGWKDAGSYLHLINPDDKVVIGSDTEPASRLHIDPAGDYTSTGGLTIGKAQLYNYAAGDGSLMMNVSGGDLNLLGGGFKVNGMTVVDSSGQIFVPGGSLTLNGDTTNTIYFNAPGTGLPSPVGRSDGTKVVLSPSPDNFASGTLTDHAIGVDTATGTQWSSLPAASSGYNYSWYGGATLGMQLDGAGHLGIGTPADPVFTLTAAGGINVNTLLSGGEGYYLNGQVLRTGGDWIDSGTPGYNLKGGTGALVSAIPNGVIGSYNIAAGYQALNRTGVAAGGSNNVAIGREAGKNITSGNSNIAVGTRALISTAADSAASFNIAIGQDALRNGVITGSDSNIAIGKGAASTWGVTAATGGTRNIALGESALAGPAGGSDNFAAGQAALSSLAATATSYANIAIGKDASRYITAGTGNVALGEAALGGVAGAVGGGSDNFAAGKFALARVNAANASDNIAIGNSAATNTTSGARNIAIGRETLKANTTGSDNIAIGRFAGTVMTISSGTIAIGNGAAKDQQGPRNIAIGANSLLGVAATSTTASDNVGIGNGALQNVTTGIYNVAIGEKAANIFGRGQRNIAVGYESLAGNGGTHASTTGTDNVAIGYQALYSVKSHISNVAIGRRALASSQNSYNVAVGDAAGELISSGAYNIALGSSALGKGTLTGSHNVAVGFESLANLSGGDFNVAIGPWAAKNIISASYNIAIGSEALAGSNTTGGSNIAIGSNALHVATTAAENVVLGTDSAKNIATGTNNVIIGQSALASATTSSSNVAVGQYALGGAVPGSANVIIGTEAGRYFLKGNNNLAVGIRALEGVSGTALATVGTPNANVAIGYEALRKNINGFNNVAIGYEAASLHGTGGTHDVVAIGTRAMQGVAGDINASVNSIAIGYEAALKSVQSYSSIAIGYQAGQGEGVASNSNYNIAIGTQTLYSPQIAGYASNVAIGYQTMMNHISGGNNVAIGNQAGLNLGLSNFSQNGHMDYNVAIGNQALANLGGFTQAHFSHNIAIGSQAMSNAHYESMWNTCTTNIAIGAQSLVNNVASGNLAIGYKSMNSNTSGEGNVAIGLEAALSNVGGYRNVAMGAYALKSNIGGAGNVAIGSDALYANTGSYNIGIGHQAGYNAGAGGGLYNVAIGSNALAGSATAALNTGSYNVAIGEGALKNATGQANNVAVGHNALGRYGQAAAGGTNVAIGSHALYGSAVVANNNGIQNTAIGYAAGYSLSTGSYNLFLGNYAGYYETTATNLIIIDNRDRGSSANSVLYSPIHITTVADANINQPIGSATPGQTIRLNGNVIISGQLQVSSIVGNGVGVVATNGIFSASDGRYKTNVVSLNHDGGITRRLQQLTGIYYDWRADEYPERGFSRRRQIGFIAQDVEKVFPELVQTDTAGFKALSYDKLTAVLVESAKARQLQLDSHETRLTAAEASVEQIKQQEISALREEVTILRERLGTVKTEPPAEP